MPGRMLGKKEDFFRVCTLITLLPRSGAPVGRGAFEFLWRRGGFSRKLTWRDVPMSLLLFFLDIHYFRNLTNSANSYAAVSAHPGSVHEILSPRSDPCFELGNPGYISEER